MPEAQMDPMAETAPSSVHEQLQDALELLQVNTEYLQRPCSVEAATKVNQRLTAAAVLLTRDTYNVSDAQKVNELLGLLNLHLQWYVSDCTPEPAAHSNAAARGPRDTNSSGSSRFKTMCSREHASGIVLCCRSLFWLLCVPTAADTLPAAVRPQLTAPGSGTMHLLCQAAHCLLQLPAKERSKVASLFLDTWSVSSSIAYPSSSPNITSSSSVWCTLPHLGQGLLAVVQMLSWFMQQPVRADGMLGNACLMVVMRQLQLLVEGATEDKWVGLPSGNSASQFRSQPAAPVGETLPCSSGGQALMAVTSGATRAQVERFLWQALDLATAELHWHTDPKPQSDTAARARATTKTTASTSTSGSSSSPSWQQWMDFSQAHDVYWRAATALLQLATAEVPGMAAGARWMPHLQEVWAGFAARRDAAAKLAAVSACPSAAAQIMAGAISIASTVTTSSSSSSPGRQPIGLPALQRSGRGHTRQGPPARAGSTSSNTLLRAVQQQRKHPLASYLCWPYPDDDGSTGNAPPNNSSSSSRAPKPTTGTSGRAAAGGKTRGAGTASATTTTSRSNSSGSVGSSGALTRGVGSLDTCLGQLQLLSAAAYVWWERVQQCCAEVPATPQQLHPHKAGASGTVQLLVLLVQRLQDTPLEVRTAFLHSPAGSKVLHVLSAMAERGLLSRGVVTADGGQAVPPGQQLVSPHGMRLLDTAGDALVGLLLLPGLLLVRKTAGVEGDDGASRYKLGMGLEFGLGLPAPVLIVEYKALQVPRGCIPPPAAFFLVEQLLRGAQTPSAGALAAQLLEDSVEVLTAPSATQQQKKRRVGMKELARQAAAAQLQRLAYCSLAGSLVQVAVNNRNVGDAVEGFLLSLSAKLMFAEHKGAPTPKRRGGTRADAWGVTALLAAATAAGASTVHVQLQLAEACKGSHTGGGSSSCSGHGYSVRSSRSAAAMGGRIAIKQCTADCSPCEAAVALFETLVKYEHGLSMSTSVPSAEWEVLEETARQNGTTLQQHLQQLLLGMAWRHPVPGVCGNVLCGRLEGASAVGGVRGPKGTLCGGCRAAWYCCRACQRAAWEAHREVCGGSK